MMLLAILSTIQKYRSEARRLNIDASKPLTEFSMLIWHMKAHTHCMPQMFLQTLRVKVLQRMACTADMSAWAWRPFAPSSCQLGSPVPLQQAVPGTPRCLDLLLSPAHGLKNDQSMSCQAKDTLHHRERSRRLRVSLPASRSLKLTTAQLGTYIIGKTGL